MNRTLLCLIYANVITVSSNLQAGEFEQHGAHEHGSAKLNVALDGSALYLELESPAANIVGFEHAPVNDQEKSQLDQARIQLQNPENLFLLPKGAGCQIVETDVDSSLFTGMAGHEHHHDDSNEETEEEGHADIHAVYHFECSEPQQISYVELKIFATFPQTGDINAQVIGPRGQTQQELSDANTRIEL